MIEILGLILAILALAIGVFHVREIEKAAKEVRLQGEKARDHTIALKEVKESISTRYIGMFPEYYAEIVSLLERAKQEIIIFCDFPSYGSFSDPRYWLLYRQAIERKSVNGVKIELTCLNKSLRSVCLEEQFFEGCHDWNIWKQTPINKNRLQSLLDSHRGSPGIVELSKEQFLKMLEADEQQALNETFANATISAIDSNASLYFWLIDKNSAVFAIPSVAEREYGFSTIDQKLISAFIDMRDRYHRDAATSP
ncbi:MAG: hypothetical protein LAO21_00300 [Acidobacteriia bacterium]|nr:hypothetical protein [Terriglobia bacterium]